MTDLFADTYALFAHLDDAPAYRELLNAHDIVTTGLNVTELAFGLLRRGEAEIIPDVVSGLRTQVTEPGPAVPLAAARFKHERRQAGADCSYVDAWGYATACSLGLPFLTGDEHFRGVPGVRFVKA